MSVSSGVWVLLGSAVAGAVAGPFVFPAASSEVLANRDRIAVMSPSERTRLDQKFHTYETLTPEQREALKSLHEKLAEDQVHTKGLKTSVMNDYIAWINTIPAYRREELLRMQDPGQRIQAMKDILETQHTRTLENPEPGGPGQMMRLSPAEMSEILKIVERQVRDTLNQDDLTEFDKLSEAYRQADAVATLSAQLTMMPGVPPLFQSILREVASSTGRDGLREAVRPGEGPKRFLIGLDMALLNAAERNLRRELGSRRVSDADLAGYFQQLPAEQQDALTNLSADDFRAKLRIEYLSRETAVVRKLEGEMRRLKQVLQGLGQGFRRPQDGSRPMDDRPGEPGIRRDGNRPPFEGRRDDRPREEGPPRDREGRDRPPKEGT